MDIAAMSMSLSQVQTGTAVNFAMAKKVMDTTEVQAAGLIDMMKQAVPSFGHKLDIRV